MVACLLADMFVDDSLIIYEIASSFTVEVGAEGSQNYTAVQQGRSLPLDKPSAIGR